MLFYDFQSREIIWEVELLSDPLNTIFDIKTLPSDFELPPVSLQEKTGRLIGFEGQNVIWENIPNANSSSHS